jgi:hypothetical protein
MVREHLLSWALQDAIGGYLLAQGLHLAEERPAIMNVVRGNSRLLYWLSQVPGFAKTCIEICSQRSDLWAGLTLVHHDVSIGLLENWLRKTTSAAQSEPDAASAALVLQPQADPFERSVWLEALAISTTAVQAFDTLWWARHTWKEKFDDVCSELVLHATADRSLHWYNWAVLHPDWALHDLAQHPVSPLWAVEFAEEMRLRSKPVDSTHLRRQMVARLVQDCKDQIATAVLEFLNTRGS